jgi:hypothetical protein
MPHLGQCGDLGHDLIGMFNDNGESQRPAVPLGMEAIIRKAKLLTMVVRFMAVLDGTG